MVELGKVLEDIGLNDREARVYLATLELGESTVLPIANKADIKRTYCYDILESIRDKGLVSYVEQPRRKYSAVEPEALQRMYAQRLDRLTSALPELKAIYNNQSNKPKVSYYEGEEAILSIYAYLAKTGFDAIASLTELNQRYGDYLLELAHQLKQNGGKVRELLTRSRFKGYITNYDNDNQQVRWLPEGVTLDTDLLIYENKLVLISFTDGIHAVVIEGSTIVDTHRAMFELLWTQAEPATSDSSKQ